MGWCHLTHHHQTGRGGSSCRRSSQQTAAQGRVRCRWHTTTAQLFTPIWHQCISVYPFTVFGEGPYWCKSAYWHFSEYWENDVQDKYIDVKVVEIYYLPHMRHVSVVKCTGVCCVLVFALHWAQPSLSSAGGWQLAGIFIGLARLNYIISRLDINLPSLGTQ